MLPPAIESLYSPSGLKQTLESAGLRMAKALGQNFLLQKQALLAMLDRTQLPREGSVIEIGPGLGHLTWMLLERGLNVTAIELDRTMARMLQTLDEMRREDHPDAPVLTILNQDAKEADFAAIARETGADYAIGNLPYNVSVPILFRLAYCGEHFKGIYTTIQKEVGERILAQPKTKAFGRLSIVLNYLCQTRKLHTIGPKSFYPTPNVESVFIELLPQHDIDMELVELYLERLVKLGFSHRRKKLRSQFKHAIFERRVLNEETMNRLESDFDLDARAEEWPLEEWLRLAEWIRAQPIME